MEPAKGVPITQAGVARWKKGNAPSKRRLVVVEYMTHQSASGESSTGDTRFSRQLETDEQPFERRFEVRHLFSPIPMGWLEDAAKAGPLGMLSLQNLHHEKDAILEIGILVTIPQEPEGERSMFSAQKLEPVLVLFAILSPGESLRLQPINLHAYRIRATSEEGLVRCSLKLIPR